MPFGSSVLATLRAESESTMKKAIRKPKRNGKRVAPRVDPDEILPEYDFSHGKRNPYAARYAGTGRVVELDADVAAAFPNARAVNDALRALAGIIKEHTPQARSAARKASKGQSAAR